MYRGIRNGSIETWKQQSIESENENLGVGDKKLITLFFKKYQRILDNCLIRMNKYTEQKKLKFLVQTVMRSILS